MNKRQQQSTLDTIAAVQLARVVAVVIALPLACSQCGQHCKRSGFGTGYAVTRDGDRLCYACCAANDRSEMVETGRHDGLYLTQRGPGVWQISNWPGSIVWPVWHVRKSWHNFAGRDGRRDCWFNGPDGHVWHFVSIGNMDLGRAKRTREIWRKGEAA